MKKYLGVVFVCFMSFFILSTTSYAGFADDLSNLRSDLLNGETDSDGKGTWIVPNGFVVGYGSNAILVHLRLDQDVIDAFNFKPSILDHVLDKPLSLEIDLVQHLSSGDNKLEVDYIKSNMPSSAKVMKDTLLADNFTDREDRHTMGSAFISRPYNLQANKDYFIVFYLKSSIPAGGTVMHLNQQVVGSVVGNFGVFVDLIPSLNRFTHFSIESDYTQEFVLDTSGHGTYWEIRDDSWNCTFSFNNGNEVIHSCGNNSNNSEDVSADSMVPEVGVWQGPLNEEVDSGSSNDESTDPEEGIIIVPDLGDDDVHIVSMEIRHYKEGSFVPEILETLSPGDVRYYETEGLVENDGNTDLEDVDIDHRVDASKARFDRNDTNMGDDQDDIDEGDIEVSHSPRITLTVAADGQSVHVVGDGGGESFPVVDGLVTLYFFLDVDAEGDNDISSNSVRAEYAKVKVTVVIPPPTPSYLFSWATIAQGIQDEGDYSYSPITPKSTFIQGETMYYLAKLQSIIAPHRLKLNIQHSDGWGWDEIWGWDDPGTGWDYTFFNTSIENPDPGVWTFTLFVTLDDQNWTQLSVVQSWVDDEIPVDPTPTEDYVFNGTETCANVIYDEATWSHYVGTPKTTFSVGEEIWVLAELTDITVNHRLKIEVWVNGYHWWTEGENSSFTEVSGTLDRTYLHLGQDAEETGTFTFKTFIDVGNGWESLSEVSATVQ